MSNRKNMQLKEYTGVNPFAAGLILLGLTFMPAGAATLEDGMPPSADGALPSGPLPMPRPVAPQYPHMAANPQLGPQQDAALARGAEAMDKGDFASAEREARSVVDAVPEAPEGWHLLGLVLALQGRTDDAVAALDRAAALYLSSAEPLVIKGDTLMQADRLDEARDAYVAALERDPANWRGAEALARLDWDAGRREAALDTLARTVAASPAPAVVPNLMLVRYLRASGKNAEALQVLQAALDHAPGTVEFHLALAGLAEAEQRFDQAVQHYESALAALPEVGSLGPRLALARLFLRQGRAGDARDLLQFWAGPETPADLAQRADPLIARADWALGEQDAALARFNAHVARAGEVAPYLATAVFLQSQGDAARAETFLRAAHEAFPKDVRPMLALGRLLGAAQDYEASRGAFEDALALEPGLLAARRGISRADYRLGRLDEARELAEDISTDGGAAGGDFFWLATLEEASGQPDRAIAAYREAIRRSPDDWVSANNLAVLLTERAPAEAVSLAQHAVEISQNVPTVRDTLGKAFIAADNLDAAEEIYSQLSKDIPQEPEYIFQLGRVLMKNNKPEDGRRALEAALSISADFDGAEEARQLLGAR